MKRSTAGCGCLLLVLVAWIVGLAIGGQSSPNIVSVTVGLIGDIIANHWNNLIGGS